MGFGLADIFGQSNIDAVKKAYKGSTLRETVEGVRNAVSDVADSGERVYNRLESNRLAGIERRKADQLAAQKKRDAVPTDYSRAGAEKQALGEASFDFVAGPTAKAGFSAFAKAKSAAPSQQAKTIQFGHRSIDRMKDMPEAEILKRANDLDLQRRIAKESAQYDKDIRNKLLEFQAAKREMAKQDAWKQRVQFDKVSSQNKRIPSSTWDGMQNARNDVIAQGVVKNYLLNKSPKLKRAF